MSVKLHLKSSLWENKSDPRVHKRGSCCQSLDSLLAAQSIDDIISALQQLNGFYALVWEDEEGNNYAAVDHIRSIPLFYALKDQVFYLSDNAEWVREQVENEVMDRLAKEEFLLAGYVTGQDTLFPEVKQLQAGECLKLERCDGKVKLSTHRYYRFWHNEPEAFDEFELLQQLEEVMLNAMKRLIKYAKGRQLVVPLSGGYDSRLIVTLLKTLGYKNVICFTYGVPGNREAEYSREVAKALGFKWFFIEYSASRWKEVWRSKPAEEYRNTAGNHVSLPHVQDWLAINELLEKEYISTNSIVVPGHSGDFVAGSHIPACVFENDVFNKQELLDALIHAHLSNAPKSGMLLTSENNISSRLQDRIGFEFDCTAIQFANLYELWDWQERQSKYIVNSVRVYEQFNLEWWLPLWDFEFVKFWQNVPLVLRKERIWFKEWIEEKYNLLGVKSTSLSKLGNASDSSKNIRNLIKIAKKLPLPVRKLLKKIWVTRKQTNHFLAFEGLVTNDELKKYLSDEYNLIGIFSYQYIYSEW